MQCGDGDENQANQERMRRLHMLERKKIRAVPALHIENNLMYSVRRKNRSFLKDSHLTGVECHSGVLRISNNI